MKLWKIILYTVIAAAVQKFIIDIGWSLVILVPIEIALLLFMYFFIVKRRKSGKFVILKAAVIQIIFYVILLILNPYEPFADPDNLEYHEPDSYDNYQLSCMAGYALSLIALLASLLADMVINFAKSIKNKLRKEK